MNLDDLLRDTLSDDRWALPVPADTLPAVRRKRTQRRALATIATATGAAATVVALALTVGGSGGTEPIVSLPATAAGPSTPTPIPGSTPAYTPKTARDWFLTGVQSDAFYAGYQQPSPRPGDTVPSPHATGPLTDRLLEEIEAIGVPGASGLDRDEAESGNRGSIQLQGKIASGQDLYVGRRPLTAPINTNGIGSDNSEKRTTVEDVPGTEQAALVLRPDLTSPTPRSSTVFVCTPSGQVTVWSSTTLSLAQLRAWAFAAAQWADAHPVS